MFRKITLFILNYYSSITTPPSLVTSVLPKLMSCSRVIIGFLVFIPLLNPTSIPAVSLDCRPARVQAPFYGEFFLLYVVTLFILPIYICIGPPDVYIMIKDGGWKTSGDHI